MSTKLKKIVLIGDLHVGKTSLVRRFMSNFFKDDLLSTIGVKIEKKEIVINDDKIKLMIWDLAGEYLDKGIYKNYLQGADGAIAVFDCSSPKTYKKVKMVLDSKELSNLPHVVVANKSDLIKDETTFKVNYCFDFLTSAKTGNDVEVMFKNFTEKLI